MRYAMPDPMDSDPFIDPELQPLLEEIWENPEPLLRYLREIRAEEAAAAGKALTDPNAADAERKPTTPAKKLDE